MSDPSGANLTLGFSFFNFGFLLLLSTLSGILVCHIAILVRGLVDMDMVDMDMVDMDMVDMKMVDMYMVDMVKIPFRLP